MSPPNQADQLSDGDATAPDAISKLADTITHAGLRDPLALALDMISPIDFISSQVALFVRPFTYGSQWEQYTSALAEETNWQTLRTLLQKESI